MLHRELAFWQGIVTQLTDTCWDVCAVSTRCFGYTVYLFLLREKNQGFPKEVTFDMGFFFSAG